MPSPNNLIELFAAEHGYRPAGGDFKVEPSQVVKRNVDSQYGPYYGTDYGGREVFMPVTLGGIFLPYTWMSVSFSRTVVETAVTERRGSAKEQIHSDDPKFSLKGLFVGLKGEFPEADIVKFRSLIYKDAVLDVQCPITDIFLLTKEHGGNDKVLILDANLNENPGKTNVRGYTIEMVADTPFDLYIK